MLPLRSASSSGKPLRLNWLTPAHIGLQTRRRKSLSKIRERMYCPIHNPQDRRRNSLTLSTRFHIMLGMNKLPAAKRAQVLSMLCEGSSMQATARVCDVAFNSVVKLLADAGKACEAFHDATVRNVHSKR